ncbi:hypothetical protein ACFOOH_20735 [Planctobacterium marinum]
MSKLTVLLLFFCLSQAVPMKADEHKHHQRMGSHGMVLFSDGDRLFASHLPLYQAPHDYQLIYEVELQSQEKLIAQLISGEQTEEHMLTLLPEHFDLNKLIEGESITLNATVFKGHFERGGKPWLSEQEVFFKKPLYRRQLTGNVSANAEPNQWHSILLSEQRLLFVHLIGPAPSFDAIYLAEQCQLKESAKTSIEYSFENAELVANFRQCHSQKALYVEFQDFKG